MIDLRSDTLTPSRAMRAAMSNAPTGDELFAEDPSTRALEEFAAQLLHKEAALFVPTGTLGNALAVRVLVGEKGTVLLDEYSHVHRRERDPRGLLGQINATLFDAPDGCPELDCADRWARHVTDGSSLICLESTHTWRDGRPLSLDSTALIRTALPRTTGRMHLDGARLFNAAAALDVEPAEIAAPFDTVVFSLCKSLGAPAGALLVGSKPVVDAARELRLTLGGTLRQTGMLAAAGLLALRSDWRTQLKADHARARRLADGLARATPLPIDPGRFPTNVVMFDVECLHMTGLGFASQAHAAGIKVALLGPNLVRLTVHAGITDADVDHTVATLSHILNSRQRGHT